MDSALAGIDEAKRAAKEASKAQPASITQALELAVKASQACLRALEGSDAEPAVVTQVEAHVATVMELAQLSDSVVNINPSTAR